MPVLDGYQAMRRIRQMPAWGKMPIIALTASASHEDELKCFAAGTNAFLAKPVDHNVLFHAIGVQLSLGWIIEQSPLEQADVGEQAGELVIPPAEEIEALYQLVSIGNIQRIGERADYLQALPIKGAGCHRGALPDRTRGGAARADASLKRSTALERAAELAAEKAALRGAFRTSGKIFLVN